jgi:hypothetical protein
MKLILTILTLILVIGSQADAETSSNNLQSNIRNKASASMRGVIVALAEPGSDAAETAWLLSQQTQPGSGYAPYLLVVGDGQRKQVYRELKLPESSSPALLIFDRQGREVSRITGVRPVQVPWQHKSESAPIVAALTIWLNKFRSIQLKSTT